MEHLTQSNVWLLAAGEAAPQDAVEHAQRCAPCQARVEQAGLVRHLARAARPPDAPPSARVEGLNRFERALAAERRSARKWLDRRPMLWPALAMAACAGAAAAYMVRGAGVPPWAGAEVPHRAPMEVTPPATMTARPEAVLPQPGEITVSPLAPRPVMLPASKGKTLSHGVAAALPTHAAPPPVIPSLAAPPEPVPALLLPTPQEESQGNTVSVEAVYRFERVAALRERLHQGETQVALQGALDLLGSPLEAEQGAALQLAREATLAEPSETSVARVDSAAAEHREAREALTFLACESAVLGKRPQEAVERCRLFVGEFPTSAHARDASYVAGTLARESLGDCQGAVEDYRKALVFTGPLGSLNDDAWFWRAHCLAELGRHEEGKKDLRTFLARYPSRRVDPKVRALQQKLGR